MVWVLILGFFFFLLVLGEWKGGDSITLLPKISPVLNDNRIRQLPLEVPKHLKSNVSG